MNKRKTYKEINISGDYESFGEFYDDNKTKLYKAIIETFDGFKNKKNKILKLKVLSKIKNLEWETDFLFERNNHELLKRDILPHFETIEDYETCQMINELYEMLTN